MPNGTYGGVRGRKTKESRKKTPKTLFSSYSICIVFYSETGRTECPR